jgi:plasmid stabilization system protein ParE
VLHEEARARIKRLGCVKLVFNDLALADLEGIYDWIAKDNPTAAKAVVERLESGRGKPSTRTLSHFDKATGHRLKISFEPVKGKRARDRTSREKQATFEP